MTTRRKLVQIFACATLLFGDYTPAHAVGCLRLAEAEIKPGVWDTIKTYFASLSLTNQAAKNRSRLIALRSEIIGLESRKQQLVELLGAEISDPTSRAAVSEERLSRVRDVLTEIGPITFRLTTIARDGDMFAAENAFKQLIIYFEGKSSTLCSLVEEAGSAAPDRSKMTRIVQQLKTELAAISAAEEALGKYIKDINK